MNNDLHFSSATGLWDTPKSLITTLAPVFPWDLDVCASAPNVCANYYNEQTDAFTQPWHGLCWMNPPYGRQIGKWITKASKVPVDGGTIVCLLPARTDTQWWQPIIPKKASYVVFIKGRLKFGSEAAWIARYESEFIKSPSNKKMRAILGKLGGARASAAIRETASRLLPSTAYERWLSADYVKIDSAPFPSAFVVFGALTNAQKTCLEEFGWCVKTGN